VSEGSGTAAFQLDDGSAYTTVAEFLAVNTLIADSAACLALADDIKAAVRLRDGQGAFDYGQSLYDVTESQGNNYPKGCSVRTGGGTQNSLNFNAFSV
jgi:hypothetical protein